MARIEYRCASIKIITPLSLIQGLPATPDGTSTFWRERLQFGMGDVILEFGSGKIEFECPEILYSDRKAIE